MKHPAAFFLLVSFFFIHTTPCQGGQAFTKTDRDTLPAWMKGSFMDDYSIRYSIQDSSWLQHPGMKYHLIRWNEQEQYILARNDDQNASEAGLYTRIDYIKFTNMKPWEWGFCLSVYNAKTDSMARVSYQADKQDPRNGCNGFPFSRMKRVE